MESWCDRFKNGSLVIGREIHKTPYFCYTARMSFLFQVVFRPEPEGGFTVIVPSLPGCVTFGETLEEAKKMATEAIQLYVETLKDRKEEVPRSLIAQ